MVPHDATHRRLQGREFGPIRAARCADRQVLIECGSFSPAQLLTAHLQELTGLIVCQCRHVQSPFPCNAARKAAWAALKRVRTVRSLTPNICAIDSCRN